MTLERKSLGQYAEDLAFQHLRKNGYRLLERNWRTKLGEIDLIVQSKKKVLVFVEVKSGNYHPDFAPSDHLTERKKQKLRTLAKIYLSQRNLLPTCRFDLITVVYKEGRYMLDHFEDVIEDTTR